MNIKSDNTYSETQAVIGMIALAVMTVSGALLVMLTVCA